MSFDFSQCGGTRTVLMGADPNDPENHIWNFGVKPDPDSDAVIKDLYASKPSLYAAFPNLQGKWDGKTTVNHINAVLQNNSNDWSKVEELIQMQPRGTCFPAGTLILMGDGTQKPIESICINDTVISHTGEKRKVLKTINRKYTGFMYKVRLTGTSAPICMTDEHPVYTINNAQTKGCKGFRAGSGVWTEAKNLSIKQRVLLPFGPNNNVIHKFDMSNFITRYADRGNQVTEKKVKTFQGRTWVKRHVKLDESLARLLGLFIAEGSTDIPTNSSSGAKTTFTFCIDEEIYALEVVELIKNIFGVNSKIYYEPNKNTIRVKCYSTLIANFFRKLCGENSYNLRVPNEVFSSNRLVRIAVLKAWIDGDGDVRNPSGKKLQIRGVTASKQLANDMRRLAISCELHASVITRKKAYHQRVASNDVYINGSDCLELNNKYKNFSTSDGRGKMAYKTKTGFCVPIRNIETELVSNLNVYNIEVEEEHSYVAEGMAVHNCGGRAGSATIDFVQHILIASGKRAKFHRASHAALYFLARKKYNMLGGRWTSENNDGVAQGAIPEALKMYGEVTREEIGDTNYYGDGSDDLACKLGAGLLPDVQAKIIQLGADNICTEWVTVTSAQELADGIAAGGIGIGADAQGFTMQRDGKGFCRPSGTWQHYQTRVSVLGESDYGQKGFGYWQSWGKTTPDGPKLAGHPGNCFGVDWDTQDRVCKTGAWAVVFGFPLWDLQQGLIDIPWTF